MAENGILDYQGMNQAIYRGATSNIVVDTQSMSIEIGAGNTSHTSNLHFECNHDANVASIKLNSNVVTEFPRSKKLIKYPRVNLTSASRNAYENGYKVTFSSEYSTTTWAAEHVFDSDVTDNPGSWASAASKYATDGQTYLGSASIGGFSGEYVHLELPVSINLSLVRMLPRTYELPCPQAPKNYSIIASTDGVTYDLLERVVDEPDTGIFKEIHINTSKSYNRFAIVVEKTIGSHVAAISELEYYGVPEYDPDAHGTDVVVKSVPNVPNTDWLEVYYDGQDYTSMPATVTDKSGNNRTGTPSGGVGFDTGYKAFTFDGANDYISSTTTATLSNHTASMWIKFDSPAAWEAVYSIKPASGFDRNNFILYLNSTYFRLESSGNVGPYYDLAYNFVIGKWVHLTLVFRGSGLGDCEMYIDNVRLYPDGGQRSLTDDITITGTNTIYVGSDPSGTTQYYLDGSIANFRIFNRALTTDEIYQLYTYQKEYFGHGTNNLTLKAGRLGIGTSEPRAALDVRGDIHGGMPVFFDARFTSAPTATHVGSRIVFDTLNNSRGGGFDTSTGIFRAPIAGQYKFSYFMRGNIANQGIKVKPRINGIPTFATTNDGTNQNLLGTAFCGNDGLTGAAVCIVPLEAGGTFELIACTHGSTVTSALASYYSGFTGEYISSL